MRFERNGEDNYVGAGACTLVVGAGHFSSTGGDARASINSCLYFRGSFRGALRVARSDDHRLTRSSPAQREPRPFGAGTTHDGNGHANSGSSSGSAGKLSNGILI